MAEQLQKDLLVQSRFRNAILWNLMAGRTNAEVCRETGVSATEFGRLLNLKSSPVYADGTYSNTAQKLADHFRMLPEDLFPASLYSLTLPDTVERTFSSKVVMLSLNAHEVKQLEAGQPDEHVAQRELKEELEFVLKTLSENEQQVLRMRFGLDGGGEMSLSQTGEEMIGPNSGKALSPERVRQIEAKALRKLRHPSRSRRVRSFMDGVRD